MPSSIHEFSIQKVINRRPESLVIGGLNKFIRKLCWEREGITPKSFRFSRIPDAWSYESDEDDSYPGTINIYEVENTSEISEEKLQEYAYLWFNLDSLNIGLCLFVYDRYGENERELCLQEYFYLFYKKQRRQRQQSKPRHHRGAFLYELDVLKEALE